MRKYIKKLIKKTEIWDLIEHVNIKRNKKVNF